MEEIDLGITGTTGFIGSYLTTYLSKRNIRFIPFEGNLLDINHIKSFFQENNIKKIIHLAGTFFAPFGNLIEKNVLTTQHLLQVGTEFGLEKIIYTSTGAVYGEPRGEFSYENDPTTPNTLYGLVKLLSEETIQFYHRNHKLSYIILRFPNVYGENNKKGVIYNFLTDIQNKKGITIAGDGEQRRSFLHVSDACQAIERSLYYDKTDIFNIAPLQHYSLNQITQMLSKQYSFSINYKPEDNQLKRLVLSSSKAQKLLHFSPQEDIAKFLS